MKSTVLLLVLVAGSLFAEVKTKVAVLNFFSYNGAERHTLDGMADYFAAELSKKGVYLVLNREIMAQKYINSDREELRGCDSVQCNIESGRLLNVDKVISCAIVRKGKSYTFAFDVQEVYTGNSEQVFEFDIRGDFTEVQKTGSIKAVELIQKYAEVPRVNSVLQGKSIADLELELELGSDVDLGVFNPKVKKKSRLLQVGLLSLGAVMGGLGYWFETQVTEADNEYSDKSHFKSAPELNTQWQKVEDNEVKRNVLYGVGAVFLAGGFSYTLFF